MIIRSVFMRVYISVCVLSEKNTIRSSSWSVSIVRYSLEMEWGTWTGFIWLRTGTGDGPLSTRNEPSGS